MPNSGGVVYLFVKHFSAFLPSESIILLYSVIMKLTWLLSRYGGHYFPSIILYSVFLGFLGVDRFCLGYTCLGVAKLLTLGAIGVWWIVDIFLLLTGYIVPEGNFSWETVF